MISYELWLQVRYGFAKYLAIVSFKSIGKCMQIEHTSPLSTIVKLTHLELNQPKGLSHTALAQAQACKLDRSR
jgi:hypothetical protein